MMTLPLASWKPAERAARLSEIAAQPDHLQARIGLDQVGQQLEAAVGRRIVDEQDFVGAAQRFEDRGQPVVQGQNGRLFVVDRNDDGKHLPVTNILLHRAMIYSSALLRCRLAWKFRLLPVAVSGSSERADGHPHPQGESVHERGGSRARRAPVHGKLRALPRPQGQRRARRQSGTAQAAAGGRRWGAVSGYPRRHSQHRDAGRMGHDGSRNVAGGRARADARPRRAGKRFRQCGGGTGTVSARKAASAAMPWDSKAGAWGRR